ncbi:MAG: AzlC family ABC transporter permease, partial [Rubrivivax sp.]
MSAVPESPSSPLSTLWRHPEFRRGAHDMTGIAVGIAAWGLVTGVAMAKSGMDMTVAVLMSLMVFAGSAQLATMPLIASGAPLWVVWATAFCVNLRFIILSAAWRPYVHGYRPAQRWCMAYFTADLNYVLFMRRFPKPEPEPAQWPYFWGGAGTNWLSWQLSSLLGQWLGGSVPAPPQQDGHCAGSGSGGGKRRMNSTSGRAAG